MFEQVLVKLKKIKTAWGPPSAARSEPRADRIRTAPTTLRQRLPPPCRAHSTPTAALPPTVSAASATASRGFKKSTPLTSSPFRPSSSARNQTILLVLYQRRPPHLGPSSIAPLRPPLCPTVASSSSTPRRCTSTTSPTPAPMTPPARTAAPPRSTRATMEPPRR
jgi:hypothetical protein